MRGTIDCALLMIPPHARWMRELAQACTLAPDRVALHCVELAQPGQGGMLPGDALSRQAVALRRFDVCLLPVTVETLGWTRMALASAAGILDTPVLGLVRGLRSAALQDLLAFGLADFMRDPMCTEELKTRLMLAAGAPAVDRPVLRPPGVPDEQPEWPPLPAADAFPAEGEAFRVAKARLVTQFERHYISGLLQRYEGNISQAARAASKNRRAFWQLMRKHEIAADAYRKMRPSPTRFAGTF
ncbi:hypothetical protein PIGHUM_00341 [Pigmentiphaga humi]|uniref:DNA binding HTH domain-containing protein n=1 Tax=Pigmentiphaga humi TaxID=2478468 RepID=A0A3P4AY04_9BURK|nr:hypothetical protein [Pigmentiphaga humi]VCU68290.1 hypothetical protein PIGHUM_00341 [Pigmentiphaga humi]